jgi:DNA (cytosine-5)-methyltransferase 1
MLRFIELVRRVSPRFVLWENVPGVLSSGGGRDFGTLVGSLVECGYCVSYRVLDSVFFGVPQRRRRVFVVGCLGDGGSSGKILFERAGVRGDFEEGSEGEAGVVASFVKGVDGCGVQRTVGTICADSHPGAYCGQDAYTGRLVPHFFGDGRLGVRRLSPLECERLMGFSDGWTDVLDGRGRSPADGTRYRALGNSIVVPVLRWIGDRILRFDRGLL